jgi:hypothetical protein
MESQPEKRIVEDTDTQGKHTLAGKWLSFMLMTTAIIQQNIAVEMGFSSMFGGNLKIHKSPAVRSLVLTFDS